MMERGKVKSAHRPNGQLIKLRRRVSRRKAGNPLVALMPATDNGEKQIVQTQTWVVFIRMPLHTRSMS
jgi:hypothetical protein